MGAKGSYLFCFGVKVCPRIFGKWGYVSLFMKVVKLLSQLMGELSSSFSVKVGVHQGSAFSPLVFIMVVDVLTDVRDGSLMELLYVDDLVLCGESLNEVMDKYGLWKNAVEGKGHCQ